MEYKNRITVMLLALCLLVGYCCMPLTAYGLTITYSDVFEDLNAVANFNAEDYPINNLDYSLKVIQVAESQDNELLIYVYQPCSLGSVDLSATSINISQGINNNFFPQNYELMLLSSNGVFHKYVVKGFTMLQDQVRYYDIVSIYREFDEHIDNGLSTISDNNIVEVSFGVGKLWTACTVDNQISYACTERDLITVTDKHVGTLRYMEGYWLQYVDYVDSHYIAFSTDIDMDRVYDADVFFVTQDYSTHTIGLLPFDIWNWEVDKTYADETVSRTLTLKETDTSSTVPNGLFGYDFRWNRIETAEHFLANNTDLTDNTIANVRNKQWVFRFYETQFTEAIYGADILTVSNATEVRAVSILRLKFEKDGIVYNLGAVDNKQSGDNIPDNKQLIDGIEDILSVILGLLLLLVLVSTIAPLTSIFSLLFKGLVWLVSLPLKLFSVIVNLFKSR